MTLPERLTFSHQAILEHDDEKDEHIINILNDQK